MAELNFKVNADVEQLVKLRQEVEALKKALQDFDAGGNTKGFDELNKKYQESTAKLKEYEKQIESYQRIMQQLNISSGVADSARQITTELNNATDVFVEQQIRVKDLDKELRELNKTYLKMSEADRMAQSGQDLLKEIKQKTAARQAEAAVLKDLRKEYQSNMAMEKAAADSLVALRQQLSVLTKEFDRLSAADRNAEAGSNLIKQIQTLQTELNAAEQATGRYQRNVGNYASAWNGLGVSVQQVARELPSLAVSANTFFLAISNNLPMLIDELKKAQAEYKAFQAAVKAGQTDVAKVASVWKQLASAVFSWQTALVVGITLLSVYGKDIINFTKSLFNAGEAIKDVDELQKEMNKSFSDSVKGVGQQINKFKSLKREWQELGSNVKAQEEYIKRNESAFKQMGIAIDGVNDVENLFNNGTQAFIESLKLRAQATAAQKLAAEEYEKAFKKEIEAEEARQKANDVRTKNEIDNTAVLQDTRYGNIKSYQELVDERAKSFENEAAAIDKDAESIRKNADAYFELAKSKEDAAKKTLEKAGIESYDEYADEQAKAAKQAAEKAAEEQLKVQQKLNEQLLDLRQRNQQAEINLMSDGTEKKLAQIELDYDKAIAEIKKREKEWREAQSGDLTADQQKEIRQAYVVEYVKKMRSEQKVETDDFQAERDAMNAYLKEYGTFQEKKLAITEEYNAKISKATTEGEKLSLAAEMKRQLAEIDTEANKTTNAITLLFGDMKEKSLKEITELAKKGEEALKFLQGGKWDAAQGIDFGITKEQFDIWSQSPDKLKDISDAINENRQAADEMRPAFDKVTLGLKQFFNAGNDTKKLREALATIESGLNEITGSVNFLADSFSSLGEAFGSDLMSNIGEGLSVATSAIDKAMQGAQVGSIFGGIGAAAGAAIGVVTSLASAIAGIHDKKNEKRIQKLQEQIDLLDKGYEKLGREIEKAFSTDASKLISQQNELLEQQKLLIQQQILEEKDKKKTDDAKLKEYQDQIDQINEQLEDNAEAMAEALTGTSVMSAIDELANAYADAWKAGTDAAESSAAAVQSLIRTAIIEFLKSKLSPTVEEFMNKLADYMTDGIISPWEDAELQKLKDKMDAEAEKIFNTSKDYLEDKTEKTTTEQTPTAGGFETMSQESADELNGRFTALQMTGEELLLLQQERSMQMTMIYESVQGAVQSISSMYNIADETRTHVVYCYMELQQINDNTANMVKQLKETVIKLGNIENNTNRL